MSDEWVHPRDVPPEEVVDRCTACGAPMELVIGAHVIFERCTADGHIAHSQCVYPEAFAEG